jgi:hypothetical protein
MRFMRKLEAKKHGVPFFIKEFWPPYYISFGRKDFHGCRVLNDVYDIKVGERAAIMEGNGLKHYYELMDISYAPGDDHIVSPKEFDLKYCGTIKETRQ